MDSGARKQQDQVNRAADLVERSLCTRTAAMRTYLKKARTRGKRLYTKAWRATWQIPHSILSCEESSLCVAISHVSSISNYNTTVRKSRKLINEILEYENTRTCPVRPTPTPCVCTPRDESEGKCKDGFKVATATRETSASLKREARRTVVVNIGVSTSLPSETDRCD